MLGFHVTTQCPYCDAPNTTCVIDGKRIVGIRHSTMAADLACKAIQVEVKGDLDANRVPQRHYRPTLTMDYLAIAKCAADAAYVKQKARIALIEESF